MRRMVICCVVVGLMASVVMGAEVAGPLVKVGSGGKLAYMPYDAEGDVIPDFSNCGYMGGGVKFPVVKEVVRLQPVAGGGDDTGRIQKAIDVVGAMAADKDGIRGAVVLAKGSYTVAGSLKIGVSGVVLRGEGAAATVLHATGDKQRAVIVVGGEQGVAFAKGKGAKVLDKYVPVGGRKMNVEGAGNFRVGETVMVQREGNDAWIHELKMDDMAVKRAGTKDWGAFEIFSDRVITAVKGNEITVDAPITCAIDENWGGGLVAKCTDEGRIQQCGVESLEIVSAYDATVTEKRGDGTYAADEKHAWTGVEFRNCKNCWAHHLESMYLGYALTLIGGGAKWVTVQDCRCLEPVSIITGGRRYSFAMDGQLSLVQRCFADKGRHSFVVNGSHLAGPDVFLNCEAEHEFADSGPHQRWSTGTLWDSVKSVLHTQDREDMGSGHGWSGANDVYWNCSGEIVIEAPPTANNFAIGFMGTKGKVAFPKLNHASGYFESFGKHVEPASLYLAQLKERVGTKGVEAISKE